MSASVPSGQKNSVFQMAQLTGTWFLEQSAFWDVQGAGINRNQAEDFGRAKCETC